MSRAGQVWDDMAPGPRVTFLILSSREDGREHRGLVLDVELGRAQYYVVGDVVDGLVEQRGDPWEDVFYLTRLA